MMSLACKKKQLGEEVGRDQSELYRPYGFSYRSGLICGRDFWRGRMSKDVL
jgi:hypothetical protein